MATELEPAKAPVDPQTVEMPQWVSYGLGGLILHTFLSLAKLVFGVVQSIAGVNPQPLWFLLFVVAPLVGFSFLSIRLFNRRHPATALMMILMAASAVGGLVFWQGSLQQMDAVMGLLGVLAVCTPSARAYWREVAAARRAASV